jgi:hypothetical protein
MMFEKFETTLYEHEVIMYASKEKFKVVIPLINIIIRVYLIGMGIFQSKTILNLFL